VKIFSQIRMTIRLEHDQRVGAGIALRPDRCGPIPVCVLCKRQAKETVKKLREQYPAGTRVERVQMSDPYGSKPLGKKKGAFLSRFPSGSLAKIENIWYAGSVVQRKVSKTWVPKLSAKLGTIQTANQKEEQVPCPHQKNKTEKLCLKANPQRQGILHREYR
jgi:hypothetical protein